MTWPFFLQTSAFLSLQSARVLQNGNFSSGLTLGRAGRRELLEAAEGELPAGGAAEPREDAGAAEAPHAAHGEGAGAREAAAAELHGARPG